MLSDGQARSGAAYATDRFGLLFIELMLLFVLTAFAEDSQLIRAVQGLLVITIVLTSLRSSGTPPRLLRLAALGGAGLALGVALGSISDEPSVRGSIAIAIGLVLGVATVAILRRVLEHDRITIQQVIAALAAYVQLALTFALIYSGLAAMSDEPFFAQGDVEYVGSHLYFSVATVSTLGYGDLSPATSIGRTLVMVETLFGQILLVVLVAYLVGSLGSRRSSAARDSSAGDQSP
jgi:hypothetical protein